MNNAWVKIVNQNYHSAANSWILESKKTEPTKSEMAQSNLKPLNNLLFKVV